MTFLRFLAQGIMQKNWTVGILMSDCRDFYHEKKNVFPLFSPVCSQKESEEQKCSQSELYLFKDRTSFISTESQMLRMFC